MIERTYRCNLCHAAFDRNKHGEGFGIEWGPGDVLTVEEYLLQNTEHHICKACFDSIRAYIFQPRPA